MARNLAIFLPGMGSGTQAAYTTTTSSSTAVAANSSRRYLLIQNNSDTDIYIRLDGGTAHATNGTSFKIAASGGSLELTTWVPTGIITAINASGSKVLTYL